MDPRAALGKDTHEPLDRVRQGAAACVVARLAEATGKEMAELTAGHRETAPIRGNTDDRLGDTEGDQLGAGDRPPGVGRAGGREIVCHAINGDGEGVEVGSPAARREELAASGRTVVIVAVDGRKVGLVAIADDVRPSSSAAAAALHEADVEVIMLTGDNEATARRIAGELGIDIVIAEVFPGDKAAKVAELQAACRRITMVGNGVNGAPTLAQTDLGIAIGAGTDVTTETADVVLMRSDPLGVAMAHAIGSGTLRRIRQYLGWAVGYNAVALPIALPIAAGVFAPAFDLVLRPETAARSMTGSSFIVADSALALKRLRLPGSRSEGAPTTGWQA